MRKGAQCSNLILTPLARMTAKKTLSILGVASVK